MGSIYYGERLRQKPAAVVSFGCLLRDIVDNPAISDENLGKIVRAVMADDDSIPLPTNIEHYVIRLRDDARKREAIRVRVASYRKAKRDGSKPPEGEVAHGTVTGSASTVQKPEPSHVPDVVDSSSSEKTSSKETQKTPPIVPLEEPLEGSLEKKQPKATIHCPVSKAEVAKDKFTQAMFAYVGADVNEVRSTPESKTKNDSRLDSAWIPQHFVRFWGLYPKKVAKEAARKAFAKIIKEQPDVDKFMTTLIASVEWWKSQDSWKKDKGKFIPHPASWLNAGHWEDCSDAGEVVSCGQPTLLSKGAENMSEADLVKVMLGEK